MTNDPGTYNYASALMASLGSVFISLDLYYIIWASTHLLKFDAPEASKIVKALIGVPSALRVDYGDPNKQKPVSKKGNTSANDNSTNSADAKPKDPNNK